MRVEKNEMPPGHKLISHFNDNGAPPGAIVVK
jgi:hypothetical protein